MSGGDPRRGPDPTPILRLTTAYWDSQTFLTACRLRIFDALAVGARSADSLAEELRLDTRAATLFLNACAALGFVEKQGALFSNSDVAQTFLVSTSPAFMGNAVRYSDHLYPAWGQLEQALRTGEPVVPETSYLGQDPERTRAFVHGMHDRATAIGRALVHLVDLGGRRQMLDVGGGPGTYSMMFTERCPGLRSTVLELAGVAEIAKEIVASHGATERVSFLVGSYHEQAFPGGNDVVLMSGMFHRETEASCRKLIDKARAALKPGGMLIVSDVFTDAGGAAPLFATLFGLNMLLTAPDGTVHADSVVADWMKAAGFGGLASKAFPPPMPHRVVTGIAG